MNWLIFTDLDGTLLDANTYSFSAAQDAIDFLKANTIPIIPCTSKTQQEVDLLRENLGIKDPFIVENGSAIFFENNFFKYVPPPTESIYGTRVINLGKSYDEIITFLGELRSKFNIYINGFHEMNTDEVQKHTGLDESGARLAQNRNFSEPFVVDNWDDKLLDEMNAYIQNNGFRLLRGNRFFHLLGNSDKGKAVSVLTDLFRQNYQHEVFRTIGIGDSMNDLEMLKSVDIPVLVRKPDGHFQSGIDLKNLFVTKGVGPDGWNEAVFKFIKK